jgi:CheY-like chemotaxis protein
MNNELKINGDAEGDTDQVCLFSENYLDIFLDRRLLAIHAAWKGYQSVQSIQNGCERLLEAMTECATYQVLYDQTDVVGIWRAASKWLAKDWFPRMHRAGLKRFAWVCSPAKLSQVSSDLVLSMIQPGPLGVKSFYDIDAARTWLRPHSIQSMLKQPRRLRAVVIEDNRDFAQLFRDMLQIMGCDATPAVTAQAGLELIRQELPDLVFCDIGLPGAMDGFGLARALRADPLIASIPLIAVSGYTSDENRQRALYAGFDRVCSKPVKFTQVSEVLAVVLNRCNEIT